MYPGDPPAAVTVAVPLDEPHVELVVSVVAVGRVLMVKLAVWVHPLEFI